MKKIKSFVADFGWPRLIISFYVAVLFIFAPFLGVRIDSSLKEIFVRFGQNGVLVLAMVPMLQSGSGLNFGLPVGIVAGLLGSTLAMQLQLSGGPGFFMAILLSMPFALVFGWLFGLLLNKVKGEEMPLTMYVGFSVVTLMAIVWLWLPYSNPAMLWGNTARGLRTTITLDGYWSGILNNFLVVKIGSFFEFPTGAILFFTLMAMLMRLFMHSRTGVVLAGGVSVNKSRLIGVIVSTIYGAVGILVYQQGFGSIQLYNAPLYMAFPAVAAILLGGASLHKATILNVVAGTFLFQSILTMTPPVIDSALRTDLSEVIGILISNGIIIYALTRKTRVTK